jgi:agmatine/peptidylarginine deiminase
MQKGIQIKIRKRKKGLEFDFSGWGGPRVDIRRCRGLSIMS